MATMDERKRKLKNKIRKHFKQSYKRMTLKLDDCVLGVEYMFGGKFGLLKKTKKSVTTLAFIVDVDKLVDLIYDQRFKSENKIYNTLKGMGRK
jgi:hypothetical protein